jgi:hypothetical protein
LGRGELRTDRFLSSPYCGTTHPSLDSTSPMPSMSCVASIPSFLLSNRPLCTDRNSERFLLTVQKSNLIDRGPGYVTVEFQTGPNLFSYEYSVACYEQNTEIPTDDCGAVASAGLKPLGVSSGNLPRLHSKVCCSHGTLSQSQFETHTSTCVHALSFSLSLTLPIPF